MFYLDFQARRAGAHAATSNTSCTLTRLGRPPVARFPIYITSPLIPSTARDRPLRLLRTCAAVGINAFDDKSLKNDHEEQSDDESDDEFVPPPLPTSALELLSKVLTGIAASNGTDDTTFHPIGTYNAFNGNSSQAYQPLRFCVNCCRPLAGPSGSVCTGCGHHPRRDAEVLGHPTAWVEAYAAQLQRQQQQNRQQQRQEPQQQKNNQTQLQLQESLDGRSVATGSAAETGDTAPPAQRPAPAAGGDVLLAADARTLLHRSSLPPYPGRPERLQAILSRLYSRGLMDRCRLLACRPATDSELLAVHSPELVAAVRGMGQHQQQQRQKEHTLLGIVNGGADSCYCSCGGTSTTIATSASASSQQQQWERQQQQQGQEQEQQQHRPLCADTLYNEHTCTAALLAAGAAADVGVALARGEARAALVVMRPPGAQAGFDVARGGCYLNNVAVAAAAALSAGLQRVMVVDWDVHHGRGTQTIFADDPRVMVVSMHRYDSETYPGSGSVEEVGEGRGEGTTLNVAFGRGGGGAVAGASSNSGEGGLVDGDLLSAVLHVVLPVAYQFRPQLVLVAAGFGTLKGDPIGGCNCTPAVFAHLTHLLAGVAPRGLGLLLEGGYNLAATSEAVEGCLRVLLGEVPPPLPGPWGTTREGWVAIMNAMQIHSHYWSALHPLSFHGWTSAIADQQRHLREQQREVEEEAAEERRALQLALHAQQQEEEEEQQKQQQEAEEDERLRAHFWASALRGDGKSDLREEDQEAEGEVAEKDDGGKGDDGEGACLTAEDLARVAMALQRARAGWDGAQRHGGKLDGKEASGPAAELADPRAISPRELLDLFLGTASSKEQEKEEEEVEGSALGSASKSRSVPFSGDEL